MTYTPIIHQFPPRKPFELRWHQGLMLRSTNWLGDAIMTLPAAFQISRFLPKFCGYFVLCPKFLAPLWRACPWVDAVIEMQGKHVSQEEARLARQFCAGVGVVFPNSFGSAMDMFKCGIPIRIGRKGRFRSLLLTHRLQEWPRSKEAADFHQLSYYLDLAASLGEVNWDWQYPSLRTDESLAERLGMTDGRWLALAPGAAYGPAKQWFPEYFAEVARWHLKAGGRVVFVGTSKEASVTGQLAASLPGSLDLAGKTSLEELMAVLAKADMAVANDSGAMHLAAAVGTPGVAIFGSTDPTATGPIGAPWKLLIAKAKCRPCLQRTCPRVDMQYACMREITPEMVIKEIT